MKGKFTYKHLLFAGVLILLCISRLQSKFRIFSEKPLEGAIVAEAKPVWSWKNWFDESFQIQFDKQYNQNFGFRNTIVRVNCQVGYSLFSTVKASGVILGEDGYLFEDNYILAATGRDFAGTGKIVSDAEKLKKVQDTLQKLNKHLVVIFAPGKASFFPEYIPENRKRSGHFPTNYASYVKAFGERNIHTIDFKKYFESMKSTSPYPLFGKCGIHWSKYGEFLAADSINKYIHKVVGRPGSRLILESVKKETKNSDDDYDIGKGMNLLFRMNTYPMGYPVFRIEPKEAKTNPKTLFVSDSFYWGMFGQSFSIDLFGNGDFWYYNEQIYQGRPYEDFPVKSVDLKTRLESHEVIIILSTDANLNRFSFGFVDAAYDLYFPNGKHK